MARLLAAALLVAGTFSLWLAWVAFEVLCEEGCTGRPWPLVAQLVVACAGFVLAVLAAVVSVRRGVDAARRLLLAAAVGYAVWALLLVASV